jgi:hypothetical protein
MYKLIVLDLRHNRAIEYTGFEVELDSDQIEDFVAERHDPGDCLWMFTDVNIEQVIVN